METYCLTLILLSNAPALSGRITIHSCFWPILLSTENDRFAAAAAAADDDRLLCVRLDREDRKAGLVGNMRFIAITETYFLSTKASRILRNLYHSWWWGSEISMWRDPRAGHFNPEHSDFAVEFEGTLPLLFRASCDTQPPAAIDHVLSHLHLLLKAGRHQYTYMFVCS